MRFHHPSRYFGKEVTMTLLSDVSPILFQHHAHNRHGLAPNLVSPIMDQTAGYFEQPEQRDTVAGSRCNVRGYPDRGSDACFNLDEHV